MKQKEFEKDLATVMATAAGRRVLSDIVSLTGVNAISNPESPTKMAFQEGRRSIGLTIMGAMVSADTPMYLKGMEENMGKPMPKPKVYEPMEPKE
jgi:hypothetical protein